MEERLLLAKRSVSQSSCNLSFLSLLNSANLNPESFMECGKWFNPQTLNPNPYVAPTPYNLKP